MSIKIMVEVLEMQEIGGAEKLVMLALADNANDGGLCFPSMRTIARKATLTERGARGVVRRLTKRGFLEVEINVSGGRKGNDYRLVTNPEKQPEESEPELVLPPATGEGRSAVGGNGGSGDGGTGVPPNLKGTTKVKRDSSESPKKGSRLSENWTLPQPWEAWATQQGLTDQQVRFHADQFRDYWISVPGQRGVKLDWQATWRNRIRDVIARGTFSNGGSSDRPEPKTASDYIMEEMRREKAKLRAVQ
jgi:hypothetical protein